ncbi:hypothetical protein ONZ45_g14562 [Pleurotus djamor]|nr:hypothetical protein ONZ45_g14562 [Pleurotus djamor]
MILTFAGSSHTKYYKYLLEQIVSLKMESSKEFTKCYLDNMLVNPSGLPGHFMAGDKFQEQLQDELYDAINSDAEFDDHYVRNIIAPNIHRFIQIKKNVHESLGLSRRSGNHIEPHADVEINRLLNIYKDTELHSFRSGRSYDDDHYKVDDLGRGIDKLQNGRLESWAQETTKAQGPEWAPANDTVRSIREPQEYNQHGYEDQDDEDRDEGADDLGFHEHTVGRVDVVDGNYIINVGLRADDIETDDSDVDN